MHLFIPFFDTDRTERTLWDARRLVQPGDRVTVMVAVIVPANLPVDVDAGEIWARVCQAERRISHTREAAERILPHGVHLRCARIQARDMTSAILAGLANYQADLLMLTVPQGIRGAFAMRVGTIPAVIRNAPCSVRFVGAATPSQPRSPVIEPDAVEPLSALHVIAVNPTLTGSGAANDTRKAEGQHAT